MNANTDSNDPWVGIKTGLQEFAKWTCRKWKFGDHAFLPFPYVDRLLRELHRENQEQFCLMTLRWSPADDKLNVKAFALPLPKIAPEKDVLQSILYKGKEPNFTKKPAAKRDWWDERLVIARYAAAAWLNLRMLLGPGALEVDFVDAISGTSIDADAEQWIKAIQWVQKQDNHETLQGYLTQVGCRRYRDLADRPLRRVLKKEEAKGREYVLGIDIGGTNIKWSFFKIEGDNSKPKQQKLNETEYKGRLPTARKNKYSDGEDFTKYVDRGIRSAMTSSWPKDAEKVMKSIRCVGVTWPGPVHSSEPGQEYVAGTSGILGKFEKLSSTITDNSPDAIHHLSIREEFQKRFDAFVRLINDGDGHVKAALEFMDDDSRLGRRLMVVVAGTGTALGFVKDDDMAPFLNEIGKMIINLAEPFLDFQNGGNFPAGIANQLFSEKTNPQIAKDLLDNGRALSNIEVSWLYKIRGPNRCDDEKMANDWEEDVFANLPEKLKWLDADKYKKSLREIRKEELAEHLGAIDDLIDRASWLAADLLAMCADILEADAVYLSGGPVTVIGGDLRSKAAHHLKEFYGFETEEPNSSHVINGLTFVESVAKETDAARGAALAALKIFSSEPEGEDASITEIDPVFLV